MLHSQHNKMNEAPASDLQRDVQRLLGRCLLRLQQYERLLKIVLAHHELAGPVDELEARRAAQIEKHSSKTLETLVKALFESYVVADGFERDLLPGDKTSTDRISMAFSFRMSMPAERRGRTQTATEEPVVLRNELVHHRVLGGRSPLRLRPLADESCGARLEPVKF
ncbi:MAG: hypothetical protein ABJB17_05930 [Burkholderiales bacterium]